MKFVWGNKFFFSFSMKESELGVIAISPVISVDKYTGVKSELGGGG